MICCYIGASKVFGIGIFFAVLASALCPVVSNINLWLFIGLRVINGMGQGVTFPVALYVISSWAPTVQFATFAALSGGGKYLGDILSNSVSGILASTQFLGGWPSIFYVYSAVGLLWVFLWFTFVNDDPTKSFWTPTAEKEYLAQSTVPRKAVQISDIPWKSILTSGRVWSTAILHACSGYGNYMLCFDIPKFMIEVLDYDLKDSGFIASVPYVMAYLGMTSAGYVSDYMVRREILSKTWTRKWCGIVASIIPAFLLFGMSYLESNIPILILLNIAMYLHGFGSSSFYVNYADLSPRFSAILCGIGNSLGSVAGIFGPIFIGFLVNHVDPNDDKKLHQQWRLAFISASVVWMIGSLQFCVFGSAEVQPWNSAHDDRDDTNEVKGLQNYAYDEESSTVAVT